MPNLLRWLGFGERRKAKTMDEISASVEKFKDTPLHDVERELGVTKTNSVRTRTGYSKNKYYRNLSDRERDNRRKRMKKFLDAS